MPTTTEQWLLDHKDYTCGYPADIHNGAGDIYLTNVERGSGCYDRISAWQYAKWRYV